MKKHIILTVTLILALACKAQNVTVSIYDDDDYGQDGVYYKDIHNDYNTFEGTWLYTNGSTSFKITLQKKEMMHVQSPFDNYYTDMLVGEYQYIENGVEKINTLGNLLQDQEFYSIEGGEIAKYGDPTCNDCEEDNQIQVWCSLSEPNCEAAPFTHFYLRYYIENGVEKLHCQFYQDGGINMGPDLEPLDNCLTLQVPYGEYVFIKQ